MSGIGDSLVLLVPGRVYGGWVRPGKHPGCFGILFLPERNKYAIDSGRFRTKDSASLIQLSMERSSERKQRTIVV